MKKVSGQSTRLTVLIILWMLLSGLGLVKVLGDMYATESEYRGLTYDEKQKEVDKQLRSQNIYEMDKNYLQSLKERTNK